MIQRLLYRCPLCGAEPWLEKGRCRRCGAKVRVGRDRTRVTIDGKTDTVARWYAAVRRLDRLPEEGLSSEAVQVSTERRLGVRRFGGGVAAVEYGRASCGQARLKLFADRIEVQGTQGLRRTIGLAEIRAATIESHTLIIDSRTHGVLFFDFPHGTGKRWEDAIDQALARFYAPRAIVEFCPRLRLQDNSVRFRRQTSRSAETKNLWRLDRHGHGREPVDTGFQRLRGLVGRILNAVLPLRVEGRRNVPPVGPVILAANHSSFLDAILLAALSPRPIAFMTKNSQFDHRMLFGLLRRAGAFPVRRYTTDAVAVRNARRILSENRVLGLFPEGERCWDGRMQPLKRTTIRLLLALGVPVVPVGIAGAYGLMPRWSTRVRRVPVAVRFGPRLSLPVIAPAAQTEADIAFWTHRLKDALETLSRRDPLPPR